MIRIIKKTAFLLLLSLTGAQYSSGQVSISNANLFPFNVTRQAMVQVAIMSNTSQAQIRLESSVSNASGEVLYKVSTAPFQLNMGLNNVSLSKVQIIEESYGMSNQASYVKTNHRLPSGAFSFCVVAIPISGLESGDDYCLDIDASDNEFLSLVFPNDGDTLDTDRPVLNWTHSESFNLLTEGEFFKLIVVEKEKDQSNEAAVTTNEPVFLKNYVTRHQVPYSLDAKKLEKGKTYAWQVQKISRGSIVNKTEAWEFIMRPEEEIKEHMFTTLKRKLDGTFYHVYNDKIYFRFDERYATGNLNCRILNEKRQEIKPEMESTESHLSNQKSAGYNQFILDLLPFNLEKGFYILECLDEKSEKFLLKFYVG